MTMSLEEACEVVISSWPDGDMPQAIETLKLTLKNSTRKKFGFKTAFVESTDSLEWLVFENEICHKFTNYGDAREGDASQVVAQINENSDLGFGFNDWRIPAIKELDAIQNTAAFKIDGDFYHSADQPDHGILRRFAKDNRTGIAIVVPANARGLLRLVRNR